MSANQFDILILGGGLAGGVCARELSAIGYAVAVVEKQADVGGLLQSVPFNGLQLDMGPHFFYHDQSLHAVRTWVSSLLDVEEHRPYAWSLPTGRLDAPHDYPISRDNALRWPDSAQILEELTSAQIDSREDNAQSSFSHSVSSLVGATLYRRYFEAYTRKFWGIDPGDIDSEWVPKKIRVTEKHEPFFGYLSVYRPRGGVQKLIDMLYEGITVIHDEVCGLSTQGDRVSAVQCRATGGIEAKHYVCTIRPDVITTLSQLSIRGLTLVYVRLQNATSIFPDRRVYWAYLPNHFAFTRVTDMTRACSLSEGEPTVLCFEFPEDVPRTIGENEKLIEEITHFLATSPNEEKHHLAESMQVHLSEAYPVVGSENMARARDVTSRLQAMENMHLSGRFGRFRFTWMSNIVDESLAIARQLDSMMRRE